MPDPLWRFIRVALLVSASLVLGAPAARSADDGFIRVSRSASGDLAALETAVRNFQSRGPSPVSVDLIAAVHVASNAYYESLNRRFESYDRVLYELVAPEKFDFADPQTKRADSPLPALQKMLTQALGLTFQLEQINYRASNFHRAVS